MIPTGFRSNFSTATPLPLPSRDGRGEGAGEGVGGGGGGEAAEHPNIDRKAIEITIKWIQEQPRGRPCSGSRPKSTSVPLSELLRGRLWRVSAPGPPFGCRCPSRGLWADPREDKINPAPGFWQILGPVGPTAGPGSLGTGSGLKKSAKSHCFSSVSRPSACRT